MKNAAAFEHGQPRQACLRHELVDNFRVGDKRTASGLFCQNIGQQRAQIADVFHLGMDEIVDDILVDLIDAAGSRTQKAATAYDSVEFTDVESGFLNRAVHGTVTVVKLLVGMVEASKFVGRMMDCGVPDHCLTVADGELCRRRAGINYKYLHFNRLF